MKKPKAEENFESSIEAMLIAWREVCEAKTSFGWAYAGIHQHFARASKSEFQWAVFRMEKIGEIESELKWPGRDRALRGGRRASDPP
jgi:hypothetical protein